MDILLIGNYEPDGQISMQLFAKALRSGLLSRGHDVTYIRPVPFFGKLFSFNKWLGKWIGYVDKMIVFPLVITAYTQKADIVHICDHSNALYMKYVVEKRHVITCHDLLAIRSALGHFPENVTGWTGRLLQRMITKGLRQAGHIVSISKATKNDLVNIIGIPDEFVSTIYYGLNYPYSRLSDQEALKIVRGLCPHLKGRYMLHVGKNNWYKNRMGLLRIFQSIIKIPGFEDFFLVLAGANESAGMARFIASHKMRERIFTLPILGQKELCALYSAAQALLFPSHIEGFGWPIVEAQACGCPVFTTNREPMTEAGGDAAVYFDPADPEGCASIITETLSYPDKVDAIRKKGIENAKRFDANKMIDKYIEIYEDLAKGK